MSKIKNTIESLIERARALSYDDQAALADHLLDQLATPAGGLAVLRAAAGLNLEAAATALALYERQCAEPEPATSVDEAAVMAALRQLETGSWPSFRLVCIPGAHAPLYEARRGELTSGLCRTVEEASVRIQALVEGGLLTEAPEGQANQREMAAAWERLQTEHSRDGGVLRSAVEAALAAGIHTVEWAVASRLLGG